MAQVKIVHVPVGQEPQVLEVEDSLESFHKLVGGFIEYHGMGGGIALVCNEDGMALGLPQNGCGILGPYFFTKVEGEDSVSLTDDECTMIRAHVAAYRLVRHSDNTGFTIVTFDSLGEMLAHLERERRRVPGEQN